MGVDNTLVAEDLHFKADARFLLSGVSLTLRPGELLGVLGPNGAGKSTLLKLLCRQHTPTRGRITLCGHPLSRWKPQELALHRAVLPQQSTIPFDFTAQEIVLLGRSPHRDASRQEAMALTAMQWTGSDHLAHRIARTLSGGELQRVNLARVLVQLSLGATSPSFLLLDEPVSNLDPAHQHGTLQLCRTLAHRGLAILVILHDLNLATQYCDRILLLRNGTPVATGTPDVVLSSETIEQTFQVRSSLVKNPLTARSSLLIAPLSGDYANL